MMLFIVATAVISVVLLCFLNSAQSDHVLRVSGGFSTALLLALNYQLLWLIGAPLAKWFLHLAFFSGATAILFLLLSAATFLITPALSLKLSQRLLPGCIVTLSWPAALTIGLTMALTYLIVLLAYAAVVILTNC